MKSSLITLIGIGGLTVLLSCKQEHTNADCPPSDPQPVINTTHDEARQKLTSIACVSFQYEDEIDLTPYIRTNTVAAAERTAFASNFKCNANNDDIQEPVVKLKMAEVYSLYDAINDQPANIRGVKISLGLSGNTIVFLLRNITMNCTGNSTGPGSYTYTPTEIGPYYKCNGDGTTSTLTAAQYSNLCNTYTANIRIRHRAGENYAQMDQGNTWTADTKSVFFSYQEIFAYYHSTNPCSGGVNDYSKDLFIYSGGASKKEGDQFHGKGNKTDMVNKHTIFLSTQEVNQKSQGKSFSILGITDVANLGHLCPPSCFPVYQIKTKLNCLLP